ncbi:hypothetical protein [Enterococcus casseliflavus]|uniref:hypothetical protein n=1 Tax=Enterococcus casseliflavus TaxID=37734 RepID=UPI0011C21C26|nr:hypothetical protein [Enterococcus casseliflavus]
MSELIKRLKEERIQGSSAVLNYSNFDYWVNWDDIVEIVEDHDQPQLNENQKLLLEDLREIKESQKDKNMLGLIWVLGQRFTTKSNIKSFTDQEILVVLQALEQEQANEN